VWEGGQFASSLLDLSYGPQVDLLEVDTLDRIDELLGETVALHLTSDVPVGAS